MKLIISRVLLFYPAFVVAMPEVGAVGAASAANVEAKVAATSKGAEISVAADEALHHLLPKDLQHALAGLIEHRMDERGDDALQDPEVDALLSGLLHDELEDRSQVAAATFAAEAAQWEEQERKAEEAAQARTAERQRRSAAEDRAREVARAAAATEAERERAQQEAQSKQVRAESDARQREFGNLMEEHRQRLETHKKQHAALQEQHAKTWARMSGLLQQVHSGLEELTHGWRDVPFWDDFFQNTSTESSWQRLALEHLQPALQASPVLPSHSVLFLEPGKSGLAERLASAMRQARSAGGSSLASVFGAEGQESHDMVVEVGLLDAMAMGGNASEGAPRLGALRHAVARLSSLVKPGGTWLSVSVVPPSLRAPLLGRLGGAAFTAPGAGGGEGALGASTHAITLVPPGASAPASAPGAALRGSVQVANLLLYGSEEAHVWAYRMRRVEEPLAPAAGESSAAPEEEDGGLASIIRQQRPGTRDDL